ncbi:patatin-like phospholipase family protein [Mariniluteicoccus flavus]
MADLASPKRADLVMEGGGVKGMAFVGAIDVLAERGYTFPRVAGTSAGAICAALVAALQHAGEPLERLADIAATLDLRRFRDRDFPGSVMGPFASLADAASLVFEGGMFEGAHVEDWLGGVLADLGVRTFGDLRRDDPGSALPPEREYGLVVTVTDLTSRRMALFPWDYGYYGLDPDEQSVAAAVRASAAIPFFFEPSGLRTPTGEVTLVDGGVLSNYPITIFDQPDPADARWPTIGVRLSAREHARAVHKPVRGPLGIGMALIDTMMHGIDARHIDEPATVARTIFVDTGDVSGTDFAMAREKQAKLVAWGRQATEKFLSEKSV